MIWQDVVLIMSVLLAYIAVAFSAMIWTERSSGSPVTTTPPVVETPIGSFVGVVQNSANDVNQFITYRSIPFAKPPIGALRFKRPQPLDNVSPNRQVNDAQFRQSCLSEARLAEDQRYGEDCLYLNVYVPWSNNPVHIARTLPVMIWIHGGGFVAGTVFPEPVKLLMRGNVIVVTINYRLGVFGFMTTQDENLPSNNGLWDQYMAIKWVNNYIHYFNGDNTSITLFGNSAGAMSIALHSISPVSSGLFHKAILQSGASTSMISREPEIRAKEFAIKVGCSNYLSSSDLCQCLLQKNAINLLQHSIPSLFKMSYAQQQIDFLWMPVIDGVLIPDEPLILINNITYMKNIGAFEKDFFIGLVNNEGALIIHNFLNDIPLRHASNVSFFKDMLRYLLYMRYGPDKFISRELEDAVYTFYVGSASSTPRPEHVLDLAADLTFIIPAIEMALSLSSCRKLDFPSCLTSSRENKIQNCNRVISKTYLYHFNYCPVTARCTPQCTIHGGDLIYTFPIAQFPDTVRQNLSDTFIDLLTTFAKNSTPGTTITSGWTLFDHSTESYLNIDYVPSVRQYMYDYRVKFWLHTIPKLIQQFSWTY